MPAFQTRDNEADAGDFFRSVEPPPSAHPAAPAQDDLMLDGDYAREKQDASSFRVNTRGPKNAGKSKQQLLDEQYSHKSSTPGTTFTAINTRYMDDPEERAAHDVSIQDGAFIGADGNVLDTTAATGTGTLGNEGARKHIFVETASGVRTADAWAEHRETPVANGAANEKRLEMVNHSSLVEGGRVKSAGELQVEQGKLQQISDQSGHYRPNNEAIVQTMERFEEQGVDLHDVEVKLSPKKRVLDDNNRLVAENAVHASAREMMAVEDEMRRENEAAVAAGKPAPHKLASNENVVEKAMRDRRAETKQELGDALAARQQRIASGDIRGGSVDPEGVEPAWSKEARGQATEWSQSAKQGAVDGKETTGTRVVPRPDAPAPASGYSADLTTNTPAPAAAPASGYSADLTTGAPAAASAYSATLFSGQY